MRKFFQFIVYTAFLLCSVLATAQSVADLTVGQVAVADRSQASLTKVAPQALEQVLVKMSGNPSIATNSVVQSAMTQADQFLQTFSYVPQSVEGHEQLMVAIRFDKRALATLLRQANQAVWRANRPVTLAWINLDEDNNNPDTVLSSDEQVPSVIALRHDADQLGLPLLLPTMDLQDQSYINDNSNMPFDVSKLAQASKRYHVKSVLAGNISSAVDGSWQGQWMFILKGQPHQWNTVGATPQVVINQAMQDMDSIMSSQLAVRDNTALQSRVALQVTGVSTLDDYAVVMNDLKQLNIVAHIGVAELDGATMKLKLNVVGGKQALLTALSHNTDLSNLTQPTVTTADSSDLYYQFQTNTTAGGSAS